MREARRIEPSKAGIAAGVLSILCALGSYFAILTCLLLVRRNFGAFAVGTKAQFFFVNYLTGACLVLGGIGLFMRKPWGWWLALVGAILGLLDLARLFSGLFGIINPDHPEAATTVATLIRWVSVPATLYIVVLVVLGLRSLRENFRITSRERSRGGRRREEEGEDE